MKNSGFFFSITNFLEILDVPKISTLFGSSLIPWKLAADASRLRHFEAYIVKFLLTIFNKFV